MTMSDAYHAKWNDYGRPMPTSAIRVTSGECDYECDSTADYLVKVENTDGKTATFLVCQSCNDENDIRAERNLSEARRERRAKNSLGRLERMADVFGDK